MRAYLLLEVFLAKNALDSSEREAQDAQRASVAVEKKTPRVEKGGPKALARGSRIKPPLAVAASAKAGLR